MAIVNELISTNLRNFGIEPFGITMPVISKKWIDSTSATIAGQITVNEADLSLSSSTNWLAPMAGQVRKIDTGSSNSAPVTLNKANGSTVQGTGFLLTINPSAYLRLQRLYANVLEVDSSFNTLKAKGIAVRPVPMYFYVEGGLPAGAADGGQVAAGEDLEMTGDLFIFDARGWIIDPLAVTSVFSQLINTFSVLDKTSGDPDHMSAISGLRAGTSFQVHMVKPDGAPYPGTHFMSALGNAAAGASANGIFTVNEYTGSEPNVLREITRDPGTGTGGAFPDTEAQRLIAGLNTYGRMANRIKVPSLPSSVTLAHDFITVKVVELKQYLLGTPSPSFNGTRLEPEPQLRLNEVMHLLPDGNTLMGRLSEIFSGTPDMALVVGETLASDFVLPADASSPYWNNFPGITGTPENQDFPVNLKDQLIAASQAQFVDSGGSHHVDVLLTLTGVPVGAAVRTYNRTLGTDFIEERGDGAGGVVTDIIPVDTARTFNGRIQLLLKDPLGLRNPDGTFTVAVNPKLNVDVVIVRQDLKGRITGNVELPINTTPIANPITPPDNGLLAVTNRGIAHAGIHGFSSGPVTLPPAPSTEDVLNAALEFLGETHPLGRDAPRLPMMARRDFLAASRTGSQWKGAVSGGRLTGQIHSADNRRGAPGGPGGRETQITGFYTQNGQLAYDIARQAYRRTESIYTRIPALAEAGWDIPAAPAPLAPDGAQDDNSGPFAGALLQNISPYTETPELALLKSAIEGVITNIPADFNELVNWLTTQINGINTGALPSQLGNAVNQLRTTLINWLNTNGTTLSNTVRGRIYDELIRELSAACYGRRDSLWSLEEGIKNARHFIYIETPAFGKTRYGSSGNDFSKDLIALLQSRLTSNPGLRVMICVPKSSEYSPAYNEFLRKEIHERFRIFAPTVDGAATTSPDLDQNRVVVFHPMGFPGRPSFLEHNMVIVDDVWMLIGSSTFRRRGLTFDGSTDMVLTGFDVESGVSPIIKNLRKSVLKSRLALGDSNKTTLENSNAARIEDGHEAFYVIREMLRAGGYGLIERLWDGKDPHMAYVDPTMSENLWNPEGQTYNSLLGTLVAWLLTTGLGGTTFHDL